jgi:hypothetical protein
MGPKEEPLTKDPAAGQQMFGSTNVRVDKCSGRQMFGSTNVWVDKCNVQVDKCLGRQIFALCTRSTNVWSTSLHRSVSAGPLFRDIFGFKKITENRKVNF